MHCKLYRHRTAKTGCSTENCTELTNDKFIHMSSGDHINPRTTKMYLDKFKYISGTQIQGLLGIQGNNFLFYLNSLSMVSKNVDSNNSFVKLWMC
jgi:hypothetical protein